MSATDPATSAAAATPAECVVVCVGASPASEPLVRAAHRLARSLGARWYAVHVALSGGTPLSLAGRDRVESHLALAESLGADIAYVVGPVMVESVLEFARERDATRIVVGKAMRAGWRGRLGGGLVGALIRDAGGIEIHVVAPRAAGAVRPLERRRSGAMPYVRALAAVAGATGIGAIPELPLSLPGQAMVYLAAITVAALGGPGPGVVAAALSVLTYNFFFIPPRFTLNVADLDHLIAFLVMFTVGTAMGTLVARLRHAATVSRQRERRTSALLAFTAEAAAARSAADVAAAVVAQVERVLRVPAVVLAPRADGVLEAVAGLAPLATQAQAALLAAHRDGRPCGRGTDRMPEARLLAVPLWDGEASAGVVGVQRLDLDSRTLLEALARQAGVAIARLRLAREAHEAALRARAEEVRSALLSTVSHDLRTPLAIISGLATTLRDGATSLTAEQLESLDTIVDEAGRLGAILHNLLAITRVESGTGLATDWIPLDELIGAALGRCEAVLTAHPVSVAVDADAGARVEPVLFEQLLVNLVENAAKHTPPGTPIQIRAREQGDAAVIEISDRGPGLPPGPPERLFEKFVRGPGVRTAGAGLGLAVCRGIAAAHGGRIEAEPRDGGGATFRVHVAARPGPGVAP